MVEAARVQLSMPLKTVELLISQGLKGPNAHNAVTNHPSRLWAHESILLEAQAQVSGCSR
jgi:hypothetical protein